MAKSIAKDKLHRFQSSKDLLAALEKIPHGERRQYVSFRFELHLVSMFHSFSTTLQVRASNANRWTEQN
jgi:hypothetical protein